jgi:acyl carrier protein
MQSEADVRATVRRIVLELAPNQSPPDVANPHLVDHLEYHSLAMLELAFALEDELELPPIDPEQRDESIRTMADLERYVLELMHSASTAG